VHRSVIWRLQRVVLHVATPGLLPCASGAAFRVLWYFSLTFLAVMFAACSPLPGGQASSSGPGVQQVPQARMVYVAIGASDTYGTGTDDPQTQSWPVDLAGKLGSGVRLINLGIPGIEAHDALNVELPVALDAHPTLVTVWLAVNDLVANAPLTTYAHDLDTLLRRLQAAAPHARVAMANVPDLTLLPRFQSTDTRALHTKITSYNAVIADSVERHHVLLIDLYQQWRTLAAHPEYISDDGFHPNALGYAQLAEIFYQALQKQGS